LSSNGPKVPIRKIETKETSVIVWTPKGIAILAAMIVSNNSIMRFAKPFHKFLEVFDVKRTVWRQMLVIIGESDK
jgi:hypothetical protein